MELLLGSDDDDDDDAQAKRRRPVLRAPNTTPSSSEIVHLGVAATLAPLSLADPVIAALVHAADSLADAATVLYVLRGGDAGDEAVLGAAGHASVRDGGRVASQQEAVEAEGAEEEAGWVMFLLQGAVELHDGRGPPTRLAPGAAAALQGAPTLRLPAPARDPSSSSSLGLSRMLGLGRGLGLDAGAEDVCTAVCGMPDPRVGAVCVCVRLAALRGVEFEGRRLADELLAETEAGDDMMDARGD
jgi:hypothetical protein